MGEITVSADSTYNSSQHLSFHDIAVDSMANPSVLRIHLKQSKTDQYHRDIDILVGPTYLNFVVACPSTCTRMELQQERRGGVSGHRRFNKLELLNKLFSLANKTVSPYQMKTILQ